MAHKTDFKIKTRWLLYDKQQKLQCNADKHPQFKNYYNLNVKNKGYLIFPDLARLGLLHQKLNTHNSKKSKKNPLQDLTEISVKLDCHIF